MKAEFFVVHPTRLDEWKFQILGTFCIAVAVTDHNPKPTSTPIEKIRLRIWLTGKLYRICKNVIYEFY